MVFNQLLRQLNHFANYSCGSQSDTMARLVNDPDNLRYHLSWICVSNNILANGKKWCVPRSGLTMGQCGWALPIITLLPTAWYKFYHGNSWIRYKLFFFVGIWHFSIHHNVIGQTVPYMLKEWHEYLQFLC